MNTIECNMGINGEKISIDYKIKKKNQDKNKNLNNNLLYFLFE